jgi:FKBP-type peptidyl-prolyl cis-trans isomerase 2
MIAIQTKYLGPTNAKGSRIKAFTCNGHSATIDYNYALSGEKLHFEAVKALVSKNNLDWDISEMTYGGTNQGYVFTFPQSTIS